MWQINELRHITEEYGWTLYAIDVLFDKCMADKLDESDHEELDMLEELGQDIESVFDRLAYIRDLYID